MSSFYGVFDNRILGWLTEQECYIDTKKEDKEKTDTKEIQPKEQPQHRKPDGILTKKIRGKTFVTEIYFDPNSKDTFQDKLLKVVKSERKE